MGVDCQLASMLEHFEELTLSGLLIRLGKTKGATQFQERISDRRCPSEVPPKCCTLESDPVVRPHEARKHTFDQVNVA